MEAFGQIANKTIKYIIVHSYVICTFTKKKVYLPNAKQTQQKLFHQDENQIGILEYASLSQKE